MTIKVYWSPWAHPEFYRDEFITHRSPVPLLKEFRNDIDKSNKFDNFFSCQAAINTIHNTFVLKNPFSVDIDFSSGTPIKADKKPSDPEGKDDHSNKFVIKNPSIKGALTINYYMNYIFFSDKPLTIQTQQPYMHKSSVSKTGYYVPGSYDISSWFRPVEGAFQLYKGETRFTCLEDEPLIYVKFLSEEPIELIKFDLSPELYNMGMSCIKFKNYRATRALHFMYKLFHESMMKNRVLKEIRKNVIQ